MSQVKIISHRGANRYAPQNTLHAFRRALELGVDGFETDLHLTADGIPVICHNYTIDDTSNGKGEIASMTLEQLSGYDFGSYFSPVYAGTKIPTLEQFLELVAASDIEVMNIELKTPKNSDNSIVDLTIDAVKRRSLFDRLLISSFSPELLIRAKTVDEKCKTGFLYSPNHYKREISRDQAAFAMSIGADALHPMDIYINEKFVYRAHESGLEVNVWTVNTEKKIRKMMACGVDGIITDSPDCVRTVMKSIAAEQKKINS